MQNLAQSLIRTYTPIIVGAVVGFLVTLGIQIDTTAAAGLTVFITAVFQGVYYLVARLLERKWPQFGFLLGSTNSPVYTPSDVEPR